jgi:hypothetical protein
MLNCASCAQAHAHDGHCLLAVAGCCQASPSAPHSPLVRFVVSTIAAAGIKKHYPLDQTQQCCPLPALWQCTTHTAAADGYICTQPHARSPEHAACAGKVLYLLAHYVNASVI